MLWLLILFFSVILGFLFTGTWRSLSPTSYSRFERGLQSGCIAKTLGFVLITLLFAEGVASIIQGQHVEYDAELGTLVISWLYAQDHPMYQNLAGPEIYSLLYGPLMVLPAAIVFKLGGWLEVTRLIGASAVLAFIMAAFRLTKDHPNKNELRLWSTASVFMALYFTFSSRMDAWVLALPMIAALGASQKKLWVVGLCAGLAFGVKATAIIYFIPLAVAVWANEGFKAKCLAISSLLFIGTAAAPFALPGISLDGYLFWLQEAALHKKRPVQFAINLSVYAAIAMPAFMVMFAKRKSASQMKPQIAVLASSIFSGAAISFLASKEGSAFYHVVPMIAPTILLLQSRKDWEVSVDAKIGLAAFAFLTPLAFFIHTQFLSIAYSEMNGNHRAKTNQSVLAEISQYIQDKGNASNFAMGAGDVLNRQNNAGIHLLKMGGTYVLSDLTMWDWHASGIPVPDTTLDVFRECKVKHWLIPAGDEPFKSANIYRRDQFVFEPIREIFKTNYRLEKQGKHFDMWSCQ